MFIVIDGTDGSGKATQTKLLVKRMAKEGMDVETIAFPQYGKKSAGPVEQYLSGAYGASGDVTARQASVLYAVDRFDASHQIREWLQQGKHVIADRFVGSNMGHQGSKINDESERKAFYAWNDAFEHDLMDIPRPDVNLVLHVPTDITLELTRDRALKSQLGHDVHEADANHLRAAERTYLELTELFERFHLIECVDQGHLLTPKKIHELIWTYVTTHFSRTDSR